MRAECDYSGDRGLDQLVSSAQFLPSGLRAADLMAVPVEKCRRQLSAASRPWRAVCPCFIPSEGRHSPADFSEGLSQAVCPRNCPEDPSAPKVLKLQEACLRGAASAGLLQVVQAGIVPQEPGGLGGD